MNARLIAAFASLLFSLGTLQAQTQNPVVLPANVPANAPAPPVQAAPASAPGSQALLQTLQQMKAANDETLRKQQATLQQLDELQKAVDQIKIYTKRS